MKIEIDTDILIREKISATQLLFLYLLNRGEYKLLVDVDREKDFNYLLDLEERGYIKIIGDKPDDVHLRIKGSDLFKKESPIVKGEVETWIPKFRQLWKDTGKSGAMGDPNACIKKMQKFIKSNPNYSVDQIFAAAKKYIAESRMKGFRYFQQADYFIYKDDINKITRSRLSQYLEMIENGEQAEEITSGRTFL